MRIQIRRASLSHPTFSRIVIFPILLPIDIVTFRHGIIREVRKRVASQPCIYFDASAEVLYRLGNFIRTVKFILPFAGRSRYFHPRCRLRGKDGGETRRR